MEQTSQTIFAWIVIVLFLTSIGTNLAEIGRERKPITAGAVFIQTIVGVLIVIGIAYFLL